MAVTLTIKQVPDEIAECLRRRASANHRSLQRELLRIIEGAATGIDPAVAFDVYRTAAPATAAFGGRAHPAGSGRPRGRALSRPAAGRLTLEELWQRARKLGAPMPSESASIVRRDRDARDRR